MRKESLNSKLLQVLLRMSNEQNGSFTTAELCIEAWHQFPEEFCLRNHIEYPDHNRVVATLAGKKGLVRKGFVNNEYKGRYKISERGCRLLNHCDQDNTKYIDESRTMKLPVFYEKILNRILFSSATNKVEEKIKEQIVFTDACGFWGIENGDSINEITLKIKSTETFFDTINKKVNKGVLLKNGLVVSLAQIKLLADLQEWMTHKFSTHIKILKARKKK